MEKDVHTSEDTKRKLGTDIRLDIRLDVGIDIRTDIRPDIDRYQVGHQAGQGIKDQTWPGHVYWEREEH